MTPEDAARQTYDGATPALAGVAAMVVPMLTVLHHPSVERIGARALLRDLLRGQEVQLSRVTPRFGLPRGNDDEPLGDACISRSPLVIAPHDDGGIRVRAGESRTRLVHRGEPVTGDLVLSRADVKRGAVLVLGGRIVLLLHTFTLPSPGAAEGFGLVGESEGIQRVRRDIQHVASLSTPVLIRGETGTGKELVARAIHTAGARSGGPFLAVNLAAVPPTLAAAELFGAERGAFTGSTRAQAGYFREAHGGTLFLDEIGEASPEVQVMLLRALETGEVQGLGTARARKVDVRLVAATDADLEAKIREGSFRAPLLHRLSSYEIVIPPLRERRDDIGRLLKTFLLEELLAICEARRLTTPSDERPWLSASLVARLADLDWSGNVRQLRNVARQLVVGSRGLDRVEIGPAVERLLDVSSPAPASGGAVAPLARRRPAEVTEEELTAALRSAQWDLAAAASQLRISRASLYLLIRQNPQLRTAADLGAEDILRCHEECGGDLDRMIERLGVSKRALQRRIRELGLALER